MEEQKKEPVMGKINRILWYIMGAISFIIILAVIFAILRRGTGY